MNKRIIRGKPEIIACQNCFVFRGCGAAPCGVVELTLQNPCGANLTFTSDEWEDGRICFNWPAGAFDHLPSGRYFGTLKFGSCCTYIQLEHVGCASATHYTPTQEC